MTRLRSGEEFQPDGIKRSVSWQRIWEIQSPPFHSVLSYGYSRSIANGSFTNIEGDVSYYDVLDITLGDPSRDRRQLAINAAYDSLLKKLSAGSAQWANNLLEANQSVGMVIARASQISRFVGKLRHADVIGAAKELGSPVPKGLKGNRGRAKSLGDQFLEFHFGWQPLLQDIHNSAQTLSKPTFGLNRMKGRGTQRDTYRDASHSHAFGVIFDTIINRDVAYACNMGCSVIVDNPNAYLANQLGLVNPASIAWEAVPFSFVADWFGNVGQVLSSMTDFVGLSVQDAYTTISEEIILRRSDTRTDEVHPPPNSQTGIGVLNGKKFSVSRGGGLSGPSLRLSPFKGLSIARGATAISLLLQKLK